MRLPLQRLRQLALLVEDVGVDEEGARPVHPVEVVAGQVEVPQDIDGHPALRPVLGDLAHVGPPCQFDLEPDLGTLWHSDGLLDGHERASRPRGLGTSTASSLALGGGI